MAELVTIHGLLRMLETVDREILNAGSNPVLTTKEQIDLDELRNSQINIGLTPSRVGF